ENQHLRELLLNLSHESVGHMGVEKTLRKCKEHFTWDGLTKDVKDYVESCNKCQRNKQATTRPYGHLHPLEVPQEPFAHISIDFVGPLPKSNHYNGIMVILDRFSSYTILIPIKFDIDAPGVAYEFKDKYY